MMMLVMVMLGDVIGGIQCLEFATFEFLGFRRF
jgi:hypothetical protein